MEIGYVIVSNEVMKEGKKIGYCYREEPEDDNDSGWRFFSGEETQEYADEPANFAMYNAISVVEVEPALIDVLDSDFPITFERDPTSGRFIEVPE